MTTTTTRYALTKLATDGSDLINVVTDFNNNWDSLDLKLGTQVCTSSTRPSSPVQGLLIYETDTGLTRKWKGAAWETTGASIDTSGARPASPITADVVIDTDTKWPRMYDGTNWRGLGHPTALSSARPAGAVQGDAFMETDNNILRPRGSGAWLPTIPLATSSARPANPVTGDLASETDTKRLIYWDGSAWEQRAYVNFVCTSGTHPGSPFQGLEIYETDTGMSAVYTGSNYSYAAQQLAPTQVLGATTASVTFSGIPTGVNHLTLIWHARGDNAAGTVNLQVQINGVTTANQITERAEANANTVAGANATGAASLQIGAIPGSTATALYFGAGSMECPGWGDTTNYTPVVGTGVSFPGGAAGFAGVYGGISPTAGTNTSIKVFSAAGNFVSGSRFSIYGRM